MKEILNVPSRLVKKRDIITGKVEKPINDGRSHDRRSHGGWGPAAGAQVPL